MRGKAWLVGGAVGALVAAASAAVLGGGRVAVDPGVPVISGGTAGIVQQALTPVSCTLGTSCVGATGATTSLGRCNLADDALLRDLVYFGNLWSLIQNNATDAPIFVAGG